jgi:hypothetical protein
VIGHMRIMSYWPQVEGQKAKHDSRLSSEHGQPGGTVSAALWSLQPCMSFGNALK